MMQPYRGMALLVLHTWTIMRFFIRDQKQFVFFLQKQFSG